MFRDIGYLFLVMSFASSFYGFFAFIFSYYLNQKKLFLSARFASLVTTIFCLSSSCILWWLLSGDDFSVLYIFKNSSLDLPFYYKISAFWSSLEGSHLLWTLLLCVFTTVSLWIYHKENEKMLALVGFFLQIIISWMLLLAIMHSNPFLPLFPEAENGRGMNELLQNYYMMIHPPSLFSGYTALAIPCAYSFAALLEGKINSWWVITVKRWTLFAWIFLTIGIFLGGRWAYVELGWAGYWAWDPVENSSFIPWLLATASLHVFIVLKNIKQLPRLAILLAMLAFFFSYFGTFLTRSGVVSSVHSFAQSPIGPHYLGFLFALALGFFVVYVWRSHLLLRSINLDKSWGVSKESGLLLALLLLIAFMIVVVLGTVYPMLSELFTGMKFNVQAPYFNTFAPYLGFVIIVTIGISNLMSFKKSGIQGGLKTLLWCFVLSLPLAFVFSYYGRVFLSKGFYFWIQISGLIICFFSALCLSVRFLFLAKNSQSRFSFFGSYLAHLGVIAATLGFLGNYRGVSKLVTLKSNETTNLYGYEFTFSQIHTHPQENYQLIKAPITITKDHVNQGSLYPGRAKYPTKDDLIHEVDFRSNFWHDIYITLLDFDKKLGNYATIEIHINPTVKIVWWSAVLMALGGLFSLLSSFVIKARKEC
jgi:cytochrome c-type biogenesis protein CcmF